MNSWFNRFFNYLRHNPGSGFILGFIFLLTICAFLLILKQQKIAEWLARVAYLSLVAGIFIELARFLKGQKD
ncbi:MAG: hypothetical protein U9Q24_03195 [Candidatus Ratteibacteria bacterium]|nr:hypothetical protein [Candidatus Ratteibacteria bacterium]